MKKYFALLFLAFMSVTMFAQGTRNRLVVVDKAGNHQGYIIENVDSVFFDYIADEVNVYVNIESINVENPNEPKVSISFSPSNLCKTYRYVIINKVEADKLKDEYMVADFLKEGAAVETSSFELQPDPSSLHKGETYTVVTMAYDKYNTPCTYSKVDFTIPSGKASVTATVDEAAHKSVSLSFTPNDLCTGYYVWLFVFGTPEDTWNQWAANLQWKTEGDMVKYLSNYELLEGTQKKTWNDLNPGTSYELYIQAIGENNEEGDLIKMNVTTAQLGGDGVAEMSIEIGDFITDIQGRDKFYYQMVKFIPNDQCAAHRDIILSEASYKASYNNNEDKLLEYMKSDKNPSYPPFIDDPYWDQFGVHEVKQSVEHETTYLVFSMSKNAKGEWGPLAKAQFTTPKKPKF